MKSKIIKSESSLRRYPVLAFILSFFFTGLGQIYNGDFSKGIVFFILRILTLLIIPLYVLMRSDGIPILFFISAIAIHVLIWLISPLESICSAKNNLVFNLRKYNSFLFYFVYGIVISVLLILSCFLIQLFFSIEEIVTNNMKPTLIKNEYVLINKYNAGNAGAGDIVTFSLDGMVRIGRIIAQPGELIKKIGKDLYINDAPLSYGIFTKIEIEKLGIDNSEDLFYEINGIKKYPVILRPSTAEKASDIKPFFLGNDELFVAFDNRSSNVVYNKIRLEAVKGIVEGIIYSERFERILNKPYLYTEQ